MSLLWLTHARRWKWWKSWWGWRGGRGCWRNNQTCLNQRLTTCLLVSYGFVDLFLWSWVLLDSIFIWFDFFTDKPSNQESKARWWQTRQDGGDDGWNAKHPSPCWGQTPLRSLHPSLHVGRNQPFPHGHGMRFYCCKAPLSQGLHLINVQGIK